MWLDHDFHQTGAPLAAYYHVAAVSAELSHELRESQLRVQMDTAYFAYYPVLPAIFWTVGVFGAVAASVLLLRSRYTVPVALVALCAQAGLDVISFGLMDRLRGFGVRQATFDVVVPLGQLQNTVVGGGGKRQTHVSTAATSQRDSCKVAPQQTSGCCTGRFLLRFENWLTRMMPRRSSLWRFDIVRSSGYIIARTSHCAIPIRP